MVDDGPVQRGAFVLGGLVLACAVSSRGVAAQDEPNELDRLLHASATGAAGADAGAFLEDLGPAIDLRTSRPAGAATWPRACSFRHPICVHGEARAGVDVLASADRAWDVETGALTLPAPDAGSTGAYDIYLAPDVIGGGQTYLDARDAAARFDRASAFSVVDRSVPHGCALDAVVARELARASLFRVAPATGEATARAQTELVADLVAPCAAGDVIGPTLFQRFDFRAIFDPLREANASIADDYERGAALFYGWLDSVYTEAPGGMIRAMWALAPTETALGAWHWRGRPDTWDVLTNTFKGRMGATMTIDDLLVEFAVARAFFGKGGDDDFAELAALGDAAEARFDWDVPWPTAPRSVASPNAVGPTGSAYVAVRHPPKGASLYVGAQWEEHARMRWTVVKVRASGEPYATLPIIGFDRGTSAWLKVDNLDDADSLLIVGVNLGDPWFAFDVDDEVFTPHGWIVKLAPQ
jgi:hypothetical protein